MMIEQTFQIQGGDFVHAGYASSCVKKMLKQLGIEQNKIKSTVIALYEGEVNIVAHAREGVIRVMISNDGITIILEDKGPGIEDIGKAMQEGFSTASKAVREVGFGAGMGLSNMKRNSDVMEISSKVGEGTIVRLVNYF